MLTASMDRLTDFGGQAYALGRTRSFTCILFRATMNLVPHKTALFKNKTLKKIVFQNKYITLQPR